MAETTTMNWEAQSYDVMWPYQVIIHGAAK